MPRKYPVRGSAKVGKRFGMVTALYLTDEGVGGHTKFMCLCDCGRQVKIPIHSLKAGRMPNCGCTPVANFKNRIGMRYGMLTVQSFGGRDKWGQLMWNCLCDCGNVRVVISNRLVQDQVRDCGCMLTENVKEASRKRRTHGMSRTRLWAAWWSMVGRCENPNNASWHTHGAMGVTICPEWRDDKTKFFAWALANGYADHLTLDRYPDNDGNYEPSNCRWATEEQQQRNRRDNRLIEWKEQKKTAVEWSEITGLKKDCIYSRIRMGWCAQDALTLPPDRRRRRNNANANSAA